MFQTYSHSHQVPDSAATATSMMCGVKTNNGAIGMNLNVKLEQCVDIEKNSVDSVTRWSQLAGKT